jgi:hypothetical protein
MEQQKIKSVQELESFLKEINFTSTNHIFRGQASNKWKILPSLFRNEYHEDHLLKERSYFLSLFHYKSFPFLSTSDPIDYLSILQHFGFPTRLLDWTYSHLIALYFACAENIHEDGVFIATDKNYFTNIDQEYHNRDYFNQSFDSINLTEFWKRLDIEDVFLFENKFKNPRMRNQDGCMMFFPFYPIDQNNLKYVSLEDYVRFKNTHFRKINNDTDENKTYVLLASILIDSNYKTTILNELDYYYGINENYIYSNNNYVLAVQEEMDKYLNTTLREFEGFKSYIKNLRKAINNDFDNNGIKTNSEK